MARSDSSNAPFIITVGAATFLLLTAVGLIVGILVLSGNPVDKAVRQAKDGNLIQATSQLEQVLKNDPDNARAHFELGKLRWRQQQYADAADSFTRASETDATNENAPLLAALSYAATETAGSRQAEIENLARVSANNADAKYLLGLARGSTGDAKGQVDALNQVIAMNQDTDATRLFLAIGYGLQGDFTQAEQQLALANAASPNNGDLQAVRGFIEALSGNTTEAIADLQQALNSGTTYKNEVEAELGILMVSQGDLNEAMQHLNLAGVENNPDSAARFFLAMCMQARGMNNEAITIFQDMARREGSYGAQAALQVAQHFTTSDPDRALDAIQLAERLSAPSAPVNTVRGRVLLQLGNETEAQEAFRAALESDSAYAPAHLEYGLLRIRQQLIDEGIRELQRYLDIVGPNAASPRVEAVRKLIDQLQRMQGQAPVTTTTATAATAGRNG